MNDPFDLAHNLAKSLAPFNHLVVVATDQAYLIGRLQDEVKQLRSERDEARRVAMQIGHLSAGERARLGLIPREDTL